MNLYTNANYMEDVRRTAQLSLPWERLADKAVLISGATGMVGSFLTDVIMERNERQGMNCRVYALGRSEEKARARFGERCDHPLFSFIPYDINRPFVRDDIGKVDFVLHLASNTHPMQYSTDPIGTITTNIIGLQNMLEFACSHGAERFAFASSNEKILTVDKNGVVTGVSGGEAYVTATTTDGSRRQAKVKVKVMQHLTGVHMLRKTAYIDYGQTSSAGAVLEPEKVKNINPNMTWESADPAIASVAQNKKAPNKVDITGVSYGMTEIYGITEDGGFRAPLTVRVGDWENSLKWVEGKFDARCNLCFAIKNVSDLNITSITLEMECFDFDGNPEPVNKRNGSNIVKAVYNKPLASGRTTPEDGWKLVDYDRDLVIAEGIGAIRVRISEFQIDNDWVKTVRKNNRQARITYNPHVVLH